MNEYFDQEVYEVVDVIKERMKKYELVLWAGTATLNTHDNRISYQHWLEFSRRLKIEEKYPGINGIGVIHSIAPENLNAYLEEQRRFRTDFRIHPQHAENTYLPITFIEPVEINSQAVGLDMAHEENRYSAAKKARDSGKTQITGPITLVQDLEKTPGFLFFAPFYRGTPQTIEARREQFLGMVYAPFVVKRLLQGVVGNNTQNLRLRIFDAEEKIYDEFNDGIEHNPVYHKAVPVEFYGRTWLFDIRSNKIAGELATKKYSVLVLVGGATITLLLFYLYQAHMKTHRRAIRFAEEMTFELNEKTEKLKRSNEDLEQFAYVASHDLQEPLRVIGNFTQLLQRRYRGKIDEKADIYIDHVVDGVKQMQELLIDLLDYARISSADIEFAEVDLNQVAKDVRKVLEFQIEEANATVELDKLPVVSGEKTQLQQLLQNLLSNAIKFRDAARDLHISIHVEDKVDQWCFTVKDNGIGMDQQYFDKIFMMFQRLHNRKHFSGTGVGLAICKKVVLYHGGDIHVESTPGEGSSFIFTLPK